MKTIFPQHYGRGTETEPIPVCMDIPVEEFKTAFYEYYVNQEDANPAVTADDVLEMIQPCTLVVDHGKIALICNCDWDIEHGIGIVISERPVRVVEDIGEII